MDLLKSPKREYLIIAIAVLALCVDFLASKPHGWFILFAAIVGTLPTAAKAVKTLWERRISIDTFNTVALTVSFATNQLRSAVFIILMLAFADLLEWRTRSRTKEAVEELLKLKPQKAYKEENGRVMEVPIETIRNGDVLVVETGAQIPVDGVIIFGHGLVNESLVTGESAPVEKTVGDRAIASTMNESGVMKIRATRVGQDSTIERMAALVGEATKNKSRAERMADRFASLFLPVIFIAGILIYVFTRDILMAAALFLVACADDMAVAIPLAMTASLGRAAKRGVIIKGGEWLEALGNAKTIVLDKTGTLTYGRFEVKEVAIKPGVSEGYFWRSVGTAEKYAEHPVGRAISREAQKHIANIPDPSDVTVHRGSGVTARCGKNQVAVGNESLFKELGMRATHAIRKELRRVLNDSSDTVAAVSINKKLAGIISVSDVPRKEARQSLDTLRSIGVSDILMFTGDNEEVAEHVAKQLGVTKWKSSMTPEEKMRELEILEAKGPVIMVGDGVNDAPALARSTVGVAMGSEGTAIAGETADLVILTDDLSRLPEMVLLGRKTASVIRSDVGIWLLSNVVGFALVLSGVVGPALAAFYNFATDFLPLFNSSRLFKKSAGK